MKCNCNKIIQTRYGRMCHCTPEESKGGMLRKAFEEDKKVFNTMKPFISKSTRI